MCDEPEWQLIQEIHESDLGLPSHAQGNHCEVRTRAEAVVVNPMGQVALLYAAHCHYHALPGGRLNRGESLLAALRREIREEIGADVEILGKLGVVIEYSHGAGCGLQQTSFGYLARTDGVLSPPSFTQEEIADGLQLQWAGIDEALRTSAADHPVDDVCRLIQCRELAFLRQARELLHTT